jgi:DNA uptake protein and related DNA-binding proteins
MRVRLIILFIMVLLFAATAQEEYAPDPYEQQLENLAAVGEEESIDDAQWQYLEHRRRHRLNLNTADEEELSALALLTDLQVQQLLHYRKVLGPFLHIYELQAVPGMDIPTIRRILPFVAVTGVAVGIEPLGKRFANGDKKLLVRTSRVLEKAKGYQGGDATRQYPGSPLHVFVRYRYQFRDLLQYGITAEKDPGEELLRGRQRYGFDFYSLHFFVQKLGIIKALALGDYSISLGQGLVHWQGQGFKKSAAVMNVKRQASVVKPYTSAGEYNFHRGAAITVQYNRIQATSFVSYRKLSASVKNDEGGAYITSVAASGYHRTMAEWRARNSVGWLAAGANVQYNHQRLHVGLNMIQHRFAVPFRALPEPYDYYSLQGAGWSNYSIDYSYTAGNLHLFGEIAADKLLHAAWLQGVILTADPAVDVALLFRNISPAYQAVAGNAFTEGSKPENETGLYTGIAIKPTRRLRVDAYADFFRFSWLRFGVHAPSAGSDYLLQVNWTPNRNTEIYCRYRFEQKGANVPQEGGGLPAVLPAKKRSWRMQVSWQMTPALQLRKRVELLRYSKAGVHQSGFLGFADIRYARPFTPWQASCRLQFFATDDYEARIYTLEHAVLYSSSAPAFFGTGVRWYCNFSYKIDQFISRLARAKTNCRIGLHFSQTSYASGTAPGSGPDQLNGNRKSVVMAQVLIGG